MQESWRAECAGTRTASTTGVTVLSESSLQPLVAGNQKVCLAGLCRSAHSVTHGPLPGVVLYCSALRHLKEDPGWGPTLRSAPQACDGPASVSSSCQRWRVGGERLRGWLHPLPRDPTALPCFRGRPAFLRRHFPPQSPPSHPLSAVKSSPRPGIAPQSLGICAPVRGVYGFSEDCLILIPFGLPQSSCLTLSLKCFSSDSDSCPDMGVGPLLLLPHPLRAGPILLRLLFSL